jgi:hypothetical protein
MSTLSTFDESTINDQQVNVVVAVAAQLVLSASHRPAQDREPVSEPAFEEGH